MPSLLHFRLPRLLALLAVGLLALVVNASASPPALLAGPVVGAPTPREVRLWVRLDGPGEVRVEAFPFGQTNATVTSPAVAADPADGWSATVTLGPLLPGTRYGYRLQVNGAPVPLSGRPGFSTAPDWRDRRPPPDATFVVLGAHAVPDPTFDLPYRPAGEGFQIFPFVAATDPAFVLWTGGHAHLRPGDLDSVTGLRERLTQSRREPALATLLAGAPQLAVLAPADFGPPGAGAWWPAGSAARAAYRDAWPRPATWDDHAPTAHGLYRWSDAAFFLLDASSARRSDRPAARGEHFGQAQLDWLLEALERTPATFRFIVAGEPLLSPVESPTHWYEAKEERQRFLDALTARAIPGVIVLAGGAVGEATKAVRARGYDLFEFVAGPSTARPSAEPAGLNYFRLPGTLITERHALLISLRGPEDDRKTVITALAPDGTTFWTMEVAASQLQ